MQDYTYGEVEGYTPGPPHHRKPTAKDGAEPKSKAVKGTTASSETGTPGPSNYQNEANETTTSNIQTGYKNQTVEDEALCSTCGRGCERGPSPTTMTETKTEGTKVEVIFLRRVLETMKAPEHHKAAKKIITGIYAFLYKGEMGMMTLDDLEKTPGGRETVREVEKITLAADLEEMKEDSHASKGDSQSHQRALPRAIPGYEEANYNSFFLFFTSITHSHLFGMMRPWSEDLKA